MATAKRLSKTQLIVERSDGSLFGRVTVNNNLIVDYADTIQSLKKQLKTLVYEFENIEVEEFDVVYDLTSFFIAHPLNIGDVAKKAGINQSLMRQYASGNKFPSAERLKQIEDAIHQIGKELTKIKLTKPQREYA
jgi:transcriptional regulator with XRE-family HTH domain